MSLKEYRLTPRQADCSPAQFTCFVPSVLFKERVRVVEYVDGVFEGNFVLLLVLSRLVGVPLESNCHDTSITLIM